MQNKKDKKAASDKAGETGCDNDNGEVIPADENTFGVIARDAVGFGAFGVLASIFFSTDHNILGLWFSLISLFAVLHAPAHFLAKSKPERALRVWLGYWRLSLGFSVWFGNWSVVLLKPVTVEEEKVKTVSVEPLEFRQKNGDVRLTLGNIQLILPVSPDQTVKHPFKDFLGSRMLLTVEDGKMWCDVRYAAAFGMPQMKLERNALIGLPSEWDCNSSDRALEIVNEKLVPIFQIYYKNDFHIVLKGAVINTNTLALTTDTNTTFIRNVKLSREETMTLIEGLKLKRIFKYPSWKYPRQFEENPN